MVGVGDHVSTRTGGTPVPDFTVCHGDDCQYGKDDDNDDEDLLGCCDGSLEAIKKVIDGVVVGAEGESLLWWYREYRAVKFIDSNRLIYKFLK